MSVTKVYKMAMHYRKFSVLLLAVLFISFGSAHAASAQVSNLFANPSVETANGTVPLSWATDVWGTTKATFTYPTGGAEDGTRYVQTQITTKGTGDAKWYPSVRVNAAAGQTFTFSDWYKSSVASTIEVEVLSTTGTYSYLSLGAPAIAANWTQFTKSFTTPANTKSITVFHYIKALGTLAVDNYSLTSGTVTPPPPAFDFSISNGGAKSVTQGSAATNAITATLVSGTTKAVSFSVSGLPSGVTSGFSQTSCSPTCSSTLTLTAASDAATGTYPIVVSAASGTTTHSTQFNLTVNAFVPPPPFAFAMSNPGNRTVVEGASTSTTITATLTSGTTKAVNFFINSSLPSGVTPSFSQTSCSPTCSTTLTFTAAANAATGTVPVSILGSANGTATSTTSFNLTVADAPVVPPAFNFVLSNGGTRSVVQGSAVTTSVTATLSSGSTQPVTFSASNLPSGVSASFNALSCSPTCTSTLTLTASASAAVGTTTVTVSATAGSLVKTDTFTLGVGAATTGTTTPPGPNVIANPSVETVNPSNSALPQSWTHEKWGTNSTAFTYVNNAGHTGTRSVKVQITKYTDGDAKWMPAAIAVKPGDSYRLTDWYQSTVENYPVIDFALSDGTDYYLGLRPQDPASTWTQFSESFQVPANAKTMQVMHLISAVGTLSLDDMSITKITPKPLTHAIVSLNFDDGWEDDTISAFPILKNLGFKATWFFATTYLENSPATGAINVSGPSAVHALFNDGQEVGGHTVTHPDLTTLNQTDLDYELNHSKQYLESLIGMGNVTNLATPYGTYSDQVIATAKPLYNSLRSTDEGFNTPDDFDQFRLEVQNMQKTTTLAQFKSWIDQANKDHSWLVLVYHRVATSSLEDFDTPIADFKPQMDYIKQSGIEVKTTQQALNEVLPQLGLSSGGASIGTITATNAASVPAHAVTPNVTNQILGGFDVNVSNEGISVSSMNFFVATSSTGSGLITNATLSDMNGVVVAGPVDATYNAASGKQKITFTNVVTIPTGSHTYTLKGKLPGSFANNGTLTASTNPSSDWTGVTGQTSHASITLPNNTVTMSTATIQSASLSIAMSANPPSNNVVPGASAVTFANVQLNAIQSGEDVRITALQLSFAGIGADLTSCQLFDAASALNTGSRILNAPSTSAANVVAFDNPLLVAKGTTKTLAVKCNISPSATNGSTYQFGVNSSYIYSATGVSSSITFVPVVTSSNGGAMTVATASLAISVDSSTPASTTVSGGTTGQTITILKLRASNDVISLTKVGLKLTAGSAQSVINVFIYNGATLVGTAVFGAGQIYATSTLASPVTLPADTDAKFTVKADISDIGTGKSGIEGAVVQINPSGAEGNSTTGPVTAVGTGNSFGVRTYNSLPIFNYSTSPAVLANGVNDLLTLNIAADTAGDVGLYRLTFQLATSTVTVSNPTFSGPNGVVGTISAPDQNNVVTALFNSGSNTADATVAAGTSKTFVLRGTVNGLTTTGSVTVALKGDTAASAIAQAANVSPNNIVWSPLATTTRNPNTNDWTNGYALPGCLGTAGIGNDCAARVLSK